MKSSARNQNTKIRSGLVANKKLSKKNHSMNMSSVTCYNIITNVVPQTILCLPHNYRRTLYNKNRKFAKPKYRQAAININMRCYMSGAA